MAIVTVDDVQTEMPLHLFSAEQRLAASPIIDGLVGELEAFLGHPLETVTVTEEPVYDRSRRQVVLARTPVLAVSSVTVDGTAIDATSYVVRSWGIDEWWPLGVVAVTYRAGLLEAKPYTVAPIRRLIITAAKRAMAKLIADQVGLTEVQVDGGTRVRWADDGISGRNEGSFFDAELARVKRWKRRSGSVTGDSTCTPLQTW